MPVLNQADVGIASLWRAQQMQRTVLLRSFSLAMSLAAPSFPVYTTTGAVTAAPAPVGAAPRVSGCMHRSQGSVERTTLGDTRAQWRIFLICGQAGCDLRESGTARFVLVVFHHRFARRSVGSRHHLVSLNEQQLMATPRIPAVAMVTCNAFASAERNGICTGVTRTPHPSSGYTVCLPHGGIVGFKDLNRDSDQSPMSVLKGCSNIATDRKQASDASFESAARELLLSATLCPKSSRDVTVTAWTTSLKVETSTFHSAEDLAGHTVQCLRLLS